MLREHLPPVREKPDEVMQADRDQVVVRSLRFRRRKTFSQPSDLKTRDGGMLHQKLSFA